MSIHQVPEDMTANAGSVDQPSLVVSRAADGDPEAWKTLAAMYGRRLFALARSRLRDDQLAEDVAQSVFATLAEKLKGGLGDGYQEQGRFESWLFRIAMNRVRDIARRQARRPEVLVDPSDHHSRAPDISASPSSSRSGADDLRALRGAMARLNAQDREVIDLRHHAGMSFKLIADMLDEPVGTVLARHHRALQKLRAMIESDPSHQDAHDEVER